MAVLATQQRSRRGWFALLVALLMEWQVARAGGEQGSPMSLWSGSVRGSGLSGHILAAVRGSGLSRHILAARSPQEESQLHSSDPQIWSEERPDPRLFKAIRLGLANRCAGYAATFPAVLGCDVRFAIYRMASCPRRWLYRDGLAVIRLVLGTLQAPVRDRGNERAPHLDADHPWGCADCHRAIRFGTCHGYVVCHLAIRLVGFVR
jgi:hypothetical protein